MQDKIFLKVVFEGIIACAEPRSMSLVPFAKAGFGWVSGEGHRKTFTTLCSWTYRTSSKSTIKLLSGTLQRRRPRDVFIRIPFARIGTYRSDGGWGYYIHIGVGSDVVCSTTIGNARASIRGMDNSGSMSFMC